MCIFPYFSVYFLFFTLLLNVRANQTNNGIENIDRKWSHMPQKSYIIHSLAMCVSSRKERLKALFCVTVSVCFKCFAPLLDEVAKMASETKTWSSRNNVYHFVAGWLSCFA